MVFHNSLYLDPVKKKEVRRDMRFCDEATSIDNLHGALVLYRRFSTISVDRNAKPDPRISHFSLPVPLTPRSQNTNKWHALPGAPHAFVTKETDVFLQISQVEEWCKRESDLSLQAIDELMRYLRDQDHHIQSFISIPLIDTSHGTQSPPIAVLNVHCSRPGLLKDQQQSVAQFVTITRPFQSLLCKMLRAHSLLQSASSVNSR